jgi:hypothetical protein
MADNPKPQPKAEPKKGEPAGARDPKPNKLAEMFRRAMLRRTSTSK